MSKAFLESELHSTLIAKVSLSASNFIFARAVCDVSHNSSFCVLLVSKTLYRSYALYLTLLNPDLGLMIQDD